MVECFAMLDRTRHSTSPVCAPPVSAAANSRSPTHPAPDTRRRLHVYTSDQPVILTEPPQNSPESREQAAEVMFESLDVPALHIGVQAQLALYADYAARQAMGSQV